MISLPYFGILVLSAILYWLLPKQNWRNLFLSIVSLAFIANIDKSAALFVVILTMFTYLWGWIIASFSNKKTYHLIAIVSLLLILLVFKYLGLFINTWNSLNDFFKLLPVFNFEKLLLPLGLSYIIFKHISYLTDIYWGIVKKNSFINFLCYGSLFTIYVAGPIERFERLNPQLDTHQKFNQSLISESFERIVYGLFKKAVIADWIGYFIRPVLINQPDHSQLIQIIALIAYSIQIYMDFSGYSDIAIGSSRLFGFKIMENFNYPYFQQNISQFWRSWHISLSDWIRDYIFFPLSRVSRDKTWNLLFVPVIAMGLCGFWHGPSWHFLLWGVAHGLAISFYQYWNRYKKKHKVLLELSNTKWFSRLSIVFTFTFVTIAWKLFQ